MDSLDRRIALATKVAWSYHGTWYTWGGDDPSGFDCSGVCIEILKSVGLLPRSFDATANGLMGMFNKVPAPFEGCLVFWLSGSRAHHVEYCLDELFSIGASGGGSHVKTLEDAIKANAWIKVRPIARGGIVHFANPFST